MVLLLDSDAKKTKNRPHFQKSDSKNLCDILWNDRMHGFLSTLEMCHYLYLDPLRKIACPPEGDDEEIIEILCEDNPDLTPAEAAKIADRMSRSNERRSEAAWQVPAEAMGAIKELLGVIQDADKQEYARLEGFRKKYWKAAWRSGFQNPYFVGGTFPQDLKDLLKMVEWEKKNGARKVRLFAMS